MACINLLQVSGVSLQHMLPVYFARAFKGPVWWCWYICMYALFMSPHISYYWPHHATCTYAHGILDELEQRQQRKTKSSETKRKEIEYIHAKKREYDRIFEQQLAELKIKGVSKSITHAELTARLKRINQTIAETKPLRNKLGTVFSRHVRFVRIHTYSLRAEPEPPSFSVCHCCCLLFRCVNWNTAVGNLKSVAFSSLLYMEVREETQTSIPTYLLTFTYTHTHMCTHSFLSWSASWSGVGRHRGGRSQAKTATIRRHLPSTDWCYEHVMTYSMR